jgi:hypothetical protein
MRQLLQARGISAECSAAEEVLEALPASSCACARVAGGSRGQAPGGRIANSGRTRRRPVSRPCIAPTSRRCRSCDLQGRHPCFRSSTTESYMLLAPASPEVGRTLSPQQSTARESVSASVSPGRQPNDFLFYPLLRDGAKDQGWLRDQIGAGVVRHPHRP